jgi:hypothetical protein
LLPSELEKLLISLRGEFLLTSLLVQVPQRFLRVESTIIAMVEEVVGLRMVVKVLSAAIVVVFTDHSQSLHRVGVCVVSNIHHLLSSES